MINPLARFSKCFNFLYSRFLMPLEEMKTKNDFNDKNDSNKEMQNVLNNLN